MDGVAQMASSTHESWISTNICEGEDVTAWRYFARKAWPAPIMLLLELRQDGTCSYESDEDLHDAAAIFWLYRPVDSHGVNTMFAGKWGDSGGVRFYPDGVWETFGGYVQEVRTIHVLHVFANGRPR